jgi:tripartite-type tricarboxylate transporter receptor subunit TctC
MRGGASKAGEPRRSNGSVERMERTMMQLVFRICVGITMGLLSWSMALAQDQWPSRPVTFIVGAAPGGTTDVYARIVALQLTEILKQPFVVENKPGASGTIAAASVANSAPDGYTILVSSNQSLVIAPSLSKKLTYNVERDFVPVARGVISPLVLIVTAELPVKTLADLVNLGKSQPGKIAYGSAGIGTTSLSIRMLEELSGAKYLQVPYRGVSRALQGMLTHDIQFQYLSVGTPVPLIQKGVVRPIVATQHTKQIPDVPTFGEAGYPDLDETFSTFSMVAPKGTPPDIVKRLNAAIGEAMRDPKVAERLAHEPLIPTFDSPEAYAVSLKKETNKWAEFIRRNNITID